MTPELTVLMPVFNELATVEEAIDRVLAADLPVDGVELVIVDDGSNDGTRDLLAAKPMPARVNLVHHERNRGKGAALLTGLAAARGRYTTILDADLEYDPANVAPLLEPIASGQSEAVFGVRGFQSHSAFSFWYVMGNKAVTLSANVLYNSWLSDIMTCHKVVVTDLFRALPLKERGFGIEPEITARLLQAGVRIYEVPITYQARSRQAGKKLTAVDGLRVLRTLARCRVDRRGVPAERRGQPLEGPPRSPVA